MIAIVGYGWVGKSMHRIFPDAVIYDEYLKIYDRDTKIEIDIHSREAVNECDIALVCVPTPAQCSGACDLSIIQAVVAWIDGPIICIKSAVPPGTVDALLAQHPTKRIVVSPEYVGEGPTWDAEKQAAPWPYIIVGGESESANAVLDAFKERLGDVVRYFWEPRPVTVELVKYMENVWLAMQVTWANEFHGIAEAVGADYERARDLWALDPRVSASHTDVLSERGFGGKCLPKDLAAIIGTARRAGYSPTFLEAMRAANQRFRGERA